MKLVKWIGIFILLPILVIKEIYVVLKESGIEIPDADELLKEMKNKEEVATPKKAKKSKKAKKQTDYSEFMDK